MGFKQKGVGASHGLAAGECRSIGGPAKAGDEHTIEREQTMKSKAILASLLVLGVVMIGCQRMMVPGAEVTKSGNIMFKAEACSPIMKADDPMAMVEAQTAAAAMAKANLLEKIKGAYITSKVAVKDLSFASEGAMVDVDGMLARINIEYKPLERTGPMAMIVTAVASLEMTKAQYDKMMMPPKPK